MKLMEAISAVDALKPNTYSPEDKIGWLSQVDETVRREVLDHHQGSGAAFEGYSADTPPDTELLVPPPYDQLYLRYLEAQIDYYNDEYDRFNNAMEMYEAAFDSFAKYYTRTHMPISKGRRFLF